MSYRADLLLGESRLKAFTYDEVNKVLVPQVSNVEFEQGSGWFAIKINGDYSMLYDSDGLLCGGMRQCSQTFPRLEFYCESCRGDELVAQVTQQGDFGVTAFEETDVLPATGMNILDSVVFDVGLASVKKVNEVWFLAHNGNYVVQDGKFIRVWL